MCAILDASALSEVFRPNPGGAAKAFGKWIMQGRGSLVVGGKLGAELWNSREFRTWYPIAVRSGRIVRVDDQKVDAAEKEIAASGHCQSNDHHVIALAQVSGARLLFANDSDLQKDFKDQALINRPRGKVYSTKENSELRRTHKEMLQRSTCRPRSR